MERLQVRTPLSYFGEKTCAMNIIKPPRLKKGDLISIVSPASSPSDHSKIDSGVRYFETLGYNVVVAPNALRTAGYLAGSDSERAADLNDAFRDRRVKAIVCSRGGYGSPRILDMLDYGAIKRNPKIFVGYSDITALHLAILKKTGLVTFSGPMVAMEFGDNIDSYSESMFFDLVTRNNGRGKLKMHKDYKPSYVGKKPARGPILGGNLSLTTSLLGTGYLPSFDSGLLLVEEVSEEPYSIDRMLTQLRLAGILGKVSGFALGQFTNCEPEEPEKPHRKLDEILREDLYSLGKPAVTNLAYGHLPIKMTLPIGVMASIDPVKRSFSIDEPAVA